MSGMASRGTEWRCKVVSGAVMSGMAGSGAAVQGEVLFRGRGLDWPGDARFRKVRFGLVMHGDARSDCVR